MENLDQKKVGRRLKALRQSMGKTQKDVAEKIGVSVRTYGYYESGRSLIPVDVLWNLSVYYDFPMDFIVGKCTTQNSVNEAMAQAAEKAIFYLNFFTKIG